MTDIQTNLLFALENNRFCYKELILCAKEAIVNELNNAKQKNHGNIAWRDIGYPSFVDKDKEEEDRRSLEAFSLIQGYINIVWTVYQEMDIDIEEVDYSTEDEIARINIKDRTVNNDWYITTEDDKTLINTIKNNSNNNLKVFNDCLENLYSRLHAIKKDNKFLNLSYDTYTKGDIYYFVSRLLMAVCQFKTFYFRYNEGYDNEESDWIDIDKANNWKVVGTEIFIDLNLKKRGCQANIFKFEKWLWNKSHINSALGQSIRLERIKDTSVFRLYLIEDSISKERINNLQKLFIRLGLDIYWYWNRIYKINIKIDYEYGEDINNEVKDN